MIALITDKNKWTNPVIDYFANNIDGDINLDNLIGLDIARHWATLYKDWYDVDYTQAPKEQCKELYNQWEQLHEFRDIVNARHWSIIETIKKHNIQCIVFYDTFILDKNNKRDIDLIRELYNVHDCQLCFSTLIEFMLYDSWQIDKIDQSIRVTMQRMG